MPKKKLFEEEKQLIVLLTSNPLLLNSSKLKKFPITETNTEEGIIFQQDILIVPHEYESNTSFEEDEKNFPSASLKILIRFSQNLQVT